MPLYNFDTTLTWSMFSQRSASPDILGEAAQIHPYMETRNITLARRGSASSIGELDIYIRLVPDDCWVVTGQVSDALLSHEQGHYDILALVARMLYKDIMAARAATAGALQTRLTDLLTAAQGRAATVDALYDEQTGHGNNTAVQARWSQGIERAKRSVSGTVDQLP